MTSVINFFREVRQEMQKVVWPSRRETLRYTILVIVFSVVIAIILGAADFGLTRLLQLLINN